MKKLIFGFLLAASFAGCVDKPRNLIVDKVSTTSFQIKWDAMENAEKYKVYRSKDKNGNYLQLAETSYNSYEDLGLNSGESYYYKIKSVAFGSVKESDFSEPFLAATSVLVPSNLKMDYAKATSIILSWYSVRSAEGYRIFRSTKENDGYILVGEAKETKFEDKGLAPSEIYYYKIKSFKGIAESVETKPIKAETIIGVPENFKIVSGTANSVVLQWDRVEGAEKYRIFSSVNENADFQEIDVTEKVKYENRFLTPGRTYYYKIKAFNKKTESGYSESQVYTTLLATPSNLKETEITATRITLKWDPTPEAEGYKVYRSVGDTGRYVDMGKIFDNTFEDTTIEADMEYGYKVKAFRGEIESDFSKPMRTTGVDKKFKVRTSGYRGNSVTLLWTKLSGVSEYKVYRGDDDDNNLVEIGTSIDSEYEDKKLNPSIVYYYKIKAVKDEKALFSNIVSTKNSIQQSSSQDKGVKKSQDTDGAKNYFINTTAISPNREIIAVGNTANNIKLWNVATKSVENVLRGHTGDVNSVSFSNNGKSLASGSSDGTVRVWNINDGSSVAVLKGHSRGVNSVVFTPDASGVISGSSDGILKIWNIENGREQRSIKAHTKEITAIDLSNNGSKIATASNDKTIKIWEYSTGKLLKTMEDKYMVEGENVKKYVPADVRSIAFSPDAKRVATGNSDNKVKIWNTETGELLKTFKGHGDIVSSLAFSPDGKTLVSASWDKTIRIWNVGGSDPKSWEFLRTTEYLRGHMGFITSVAVSSDGQKIISGSWDSTIKIWEIATGIMVDSFDEK